MYKLNIYFFTDTTSISFVYQVIDFITEASSLPQSLLTTVCVNGYCFAAQPGEFNAPKGDDVDNDTSEDAESPGGMQVTTNGVQVSLAGDDVGPRGTSRMLR